MKAEGNTDVGAGATGAEGGGNDDLQAAIARSASLGKQNGIG